MVKYTVATTVAIVQLAMLAQTTVALPIEYAEGLESRAISNPNGQQLAEREDSGELKERAGLGAVLGIGAGLLGVGAIGVGVVGKLIGKAASASDNTKTNRRDLSGWDEFEKRDFNDFEERGRNSFEERGRDDYELEARGLDFDELDELD